MPRETKIKYDPSLSVAENAKKCGVSVAAIRYYIKTRGIDRRYEGKVKVVEGMKAYLAEHPNATRAELQRATGHGINTIRRYWDVLHGTDELPTNQNKSTLRDREKVVSHKRHITYLDKLPIEFLREYMEAREAAANAEIEATPEVVEVAEQASVEANEVAVRSDEPKLIISKPQELIRLKGKEKKRQETEIALSTFDYLDYAEEDNISFDEQDKQMLWQAYEMLSERDRAILEQLVIEEKSALEAAPVVWKHINSQQEYDALPAKRVQCTLSMAKNRAQTALLNNMLNLMGRP